MENLFIYQDEFDNECTFLRKKYYEHICAMITEFFEEPLLDNEFHKNFLEVLNALEDYQDVYYLTTEMPFYWAICIIENRRTNHHLIKGKTNDDFIEWYRKYKKENDIITFIIEGINEETYVFTNDNGVESTFLRKKYYELVCSLVTDFFKKPLEYNEMNAMLIGRLNALVADGKRKHISTFVDREPYYWAMSIIDDKETTNVLDEKELERYTEFIEDFYKKNEIKSFVIPE